jgi:hypothetical protein
MGTQHNEACLNGHPPYGQYRPEIPLYIIQQLCVFGIDNITDMTSFRDLPEPNCGPRLAGDFAMQESPAPETDLPSASGSVDAPPAVASNLTHAKDRLWSIDRIQRNSGHKIPTDHTAFTCWSLLLEAGLMGVAWVVDGTHILSHPTTTPTNQAVLAALAQALFLCCNHSSDQVQNEFVIRGRGHTFLKQQQGCELFQLISSTYCPIGAKWLWSWEEQWTYARHEQSESIATLWGWLKELVLHLAEGSIVLPSEYLIFHLLTLACRGPYHDLFAFIQTKICVINNPEWDITTLTLDALTDCLHGILCNSEYFGNIMLKKGKYTKPPGHELPSSSRGDQRQP